MSTNKRAQIWETLIPWIIGLVVLVLVLVLYGILSGKGSGLLHFLKDTFTYR